MNNELEQQVKVETRELKCQGNRVIFTLPGHALAVVS
jgi:hypothetical protein